MMMAIYSAPWEFWRWWECGVALFLHRPFVLPTPFHDISILQSNAVYCKPYMVLASLLTVLLALAFIGTTSAQDAQIVYDSIHNATSIVGTWSSGAKNVLTGPVSFLLIRPLLFDLFCVPGVCKSCQYDVPLSKDNRNFLLFVRISATSLVSSG
jgi:hypothetical protein